MRLGIDAEIQLVVQAAHTFRLMETGILLMLSRFWVIASMLPCKISGTPDFIVRPPIDRLNMNRRVWYFQGQAIFLLCFRLDTIDDLRIAENLVFAFVSPCPGFASTFDIANCDRFRVLIY